MPRTCEGRLLHQPHTLGKQLNPPIQRYAFEKALHVPLGLLLQDRHVAPIHRQINAILSSFAQVALGSLCPERGLHCFLGLPNCWDI